MANKFFYIMFFSSLILISIVTITYYTIGEKAINYIIESKINNIGSRLALNLKQPLYEYNYNAVEYTLLAEFYDKDIFSLIVWHPEHNEIYLGLARQKDKINKITKAYNPEHYKRTTKNIYIETALKEKIILGILEIYADKKHAEKELFNEIINIILIISLIVFILVLTLTFIVNNYLVKPLTIISNAMNETKQIISKRKTLKKYITSKQKFLEETVFPFYELNHMFSSFNTLINTIFNKQEELISNEENLKITIDSIADGVIVTDEKNNITRINKVALNLCGFESKNVIGENINSILNVYDLSNHKKIDNIINYIVDSSNSTKLQDKFKIISQNSIEYNIYINGNKINDSNNVVVGYVLAIHNVTEQLKIEKQLQQIEKMDSIGYLAGGIAHDFNNMLGGILGSTQILTNQIGDNPKQQNYLNIIKEAATRAAELTQKLLTFSRKTEIAAFLFDVHESINSAITILERGIDKKISIKTDLSAKFSIINGDNSQIQNAILNLGINSRDAMSNGGEIIISTKNVTLDKDYCEKSLFNIVPGQYIEIDVSDTGHGISTDIISKIFDPFFTTKDVGKGTGLGLAAIYGTIKNHNGAIHVYSEINIGTTFHLYLPVTINKKFKKITNNDKVFKGSGKILVIDDEEVIRNTLEGILEELGFEVLLAENARKGIEIYELNKNTLKTIIVDMVMPEMNGQECLEEIKKINPLVKTIIASGFTKDISMKNIKTDKNTKFIKKPFQISEISKILFDFLHEE